jgi:hypothetical protein
MRFGGLNLEASAGDALTDASCSILYHASTLLSLPFVYLYFIPSIVQTVGRA